MSVCFVCFFFLLKVDGCKNYIVLSESDRAQGNVLQNNSCDLDLAPGWYRFQGAAGYRMADKCVPIHRCGTWYPGWLSGAHPTVDEGAVVRKICFHYDPNCCKLSENIKVKNCGSFYVYELQRTPGCNLRYCSNGGGGKLLWPLSPQCFSQELKPQVIFKDWLRKLERVSFNNVSDTQIN